MRKYLLDTCVLIWFLEKNQRIKDLIEDINYYDGDFAISAESIKEFIFLIQSGKLKTTVTYEMLIEDLKKNKIDIYLTDKNCFEELSNLPFYKKHSDPTDRVIIATAIALKRTLISGDHNFQLYKKLQLQLV